MGKRRIEKAVKVATKAHEGQFRKSGDPYIVHPLAVMKILQDWHMDEDTIIAGVLHDTVEDTDLTLEDIKKDFGETVAYLVDGVTKLGKVRSGMKDIDTYLPQTKDNLLRLLVATGSDIRVLIIKLADRLNMGRLRVEMSDIAFSYVDPKRYNELKELIDERNRSAEKTLLKIKSEISELLNSEGIKFELSGRIKSVYSLHKKLAKYDQNIDAIYDLTALRIIVDDITTCYLVLGLVHSLYTPVAGRIKDYIAMPKQNGYQSIHTTVITKDKKIIEFQIRTKEMHDYAEHGLAASFYYNEQKLTESYKQGKIQHLPTNLLWIMELQQAAAQLRAGKKVDLNKLKLNLFSDKIFVYTPKGDIVDLPNGSLPLDFAYRLHSEIGERVTGVKINGKMSSLNTKLKHGDIVEILTGKNQTAKPTWFEKIITPHARNKLRQQLGRAGEIIPKMSPPKPKK